MLAAVRTTRPGARTRVDATRAQVGPAEGRLRTITAPYECSACSHASSPSPRWGSGPGLDSASPSETLQPALETLVGRVRAVLALGDQGARVAAPGTSVRRHAGPLRRHEPPPGPEPVAGAQRRRQRHARLAARGRPASDAGERTPRRNPDLRRRPVPGDDPARPQGAREAPRTRDVLLDRSLPRWHVGARREDAAGGARRPRRWAP